MIIIDAIYFSWSLYNFLGIAHKAYSVYNYGRDGYRLISKLSSYFAGKNKKAPDLTDSFLIEKETVEENWQLIKFHNFSK